MLQNSILNSCRKPTAARVSRFWGACLILVVASSMLPSCSNGSLNAPTKQSVYERVTQTGVIRASYASYPPYCIIDPNTHKVSGLMVEILEESAKRLDLKIEWTEEVGWGVIFEGLNSNRYDIFGAGVWRNATRGKISDFSRPIGYNVIKAYGRANEGRFTSLEQLNQPSVKASTQDGAMDDLIAKSDFPQAVRVSLPQLSPWSDILQNILANKADVTFAEPGAVNLFLEKNPGTLKDLFPGHLVRVFGLCYAFKLDEEAFKSMLDSGIEEVMNDGTAEKIIRKYQKNPDDFYRVAKPYEVPSN